MWRLSYLVVAALLLLFYTAVPVYASIYNEEPIGLGSFYSGGGMRVDSFDGCNAVYLGSVERDGTVYMVVFEVRSAGYTGYTYMIKAFSVSGSSYTFTLAPGGAGAYRAWYGFIGKTLYVLMLSREPQGSFTVVYVDAYAIDLDRMELVGNVSKPAVAYSVPSAGVWGCIYSVGRLARVGGSLYAMAWIDGLDAVLLARLDTGNMSIETRVLRVDAAENYFHDTWVYGGLLFSSNTVYSLGNGSASTLIPGGLLNSIYIYLYRDILIAVYNSTLDDSIHVAAYSIGSGGVIEKLYDKTVWSHGQGHVAYTDGFMNNGYQVIVYRDRLYLALYRGSSIVLIVLSPYTGETYTQIDIGARGAPGKAAYFSTGNSTYIAFFHGHSDLVYINLDTLKPFYTSYAIENPIYDMWLVPVQQGIYAWLILSMDTSGPVFHAYLDIVSPGIAPGELDNATAPPNTPPLPENQYLPVILLLALMAVTITSRRLRNS